MKYKVSNVCQLCDKSKYSSSQTNYGITTTNNGDGTFTLNGTCTNTGSINIIQYMNMIIGHVYYLTFDYTGSWRALMPTINNFVAVTKKEGVIMAAETNIGTNMYCYCVINTVLNNVTIRPQLFDLTEMYGAGNEPTTVEEFRKDFPDEYYEYSPKCFEAIHKLHYIDEAGKYLSMNRGKFVTETKNLFDVANSITYTFNDDNASSNNLYVKNGLYYTAYNNYDIGSGLRIKDGLALPAGTYTLSVEVVDCYNIDFLNIGFRYKGSSGEWFNPAWRFTEYKFGGRISVSFNITETTDLRLYINYQNNNGITFTGFVKYKNIQLEQGSTATDYQPYKHIAFN